MIDPFALAKMLNPNLDDVLEKKKLDERDSIRKGEITIIPCRHWPRIILTNGSIQCLSTCGKMIKEVKQKGE